VGSLVFLLAKEFLKLVCIAFVVAAPLAYLGMDRWLQGFAYRADVSGGAFLLAGLGALGIALLTVSYQAVRAARANPVDTLRYE
jgi:putative ABC transport system permease protein